MNVSKMFVILDVFKDAFCFAHNSYLAPIIIVL